MATDGRGNRDSAPAGGSSRRVAGGRGMTSNSPLTPAHRSRRRTFSLRIVDFVLLLAVAAWVGGGTRAHYRRQADREVNAIIDNKALALGEAPGGYRIDVDPRSRMFDANSPDCPPRPPDDPISHKLMECVDGKPGAPVWNKLATTTRVDNPPWKDFLPRDKEGNVVLDLTGAVQVVC